MDEFRFRADRYAKLAGRALETVHMGFGQDGYLWATEQTTAVKVFARQGNYDRELGCYQRLSEHNITAIGNFRVPRFVGCNDELMIVEMSIVSPPFLLDFGKAYLDQRPDYSPETIEYWEAEVKELFGDRIGEVKAALRALAAIGIYYYDAKLGNIKF
ncbi:MAG: type IV conjugative transfer system protein TraE [Planctomycetia bacterium]|nr:type IV conjugative transfer system protein TraE [Planctomycetia bacterium]